MVTCEEFYKKWEHDRNFCHKSNVTMKQIDVYIEYRKRNHIQNIEINRCALAPLIRIEDYIELHNNSVKEIKKQVKKLGVKNITQRHVIEIINKINSELPVDLRINNIMKNENQHMIENISFDTRQSFEKLKNEIHVRKNNDFMKLIFKFCNDNKEILKERLI